MKITILLFSIALVEARISELKVNFGDCFWGQLSPVYFETTKICCAGNKYVLMEKASKKCVTAEPSFALDYDIDNVGDEIWGYAAHLEGNYILPGQIGFDCEHAHHSGEDCGATAF